MKQVLVDLFQSHQSWLPFTIAGICLLLALGFLGAKLYALKLGWKSLNKPGARLSYEPAPGLLSNSEQEAFHRLVESLEPDYRVFSKVRLADIVRPQAGDAYLADFSRISQKHVDFAICEPEEFQIVCVIEWDDPSHQTQAASRRDEIKDAALDSAGVGRIRIDSEKPELWPEAFEWVRAEAESNAS